jgi:hypothetical protein
MGTVIVALAGIDDALEADELVGGGGKGFSGSDDAVRASIGKDFVAGLLPNFDFGATQAAEGPLALYEGLDEGVLGWIGREILLVVLGREQCEAFSGFFGYDLGFVVDAVLRGVEGGCGRALGGAWDGSLLCLAALRRETFDGCHKSSCLKSSRGGGSELPDYFRKVFGMKQLTIFEAL